MSAQRILFVDDDDDLRALGALCLRTAGQFDVLLAKSGSEALTLARAEQPDLILLDISMPGMDGIGTLCELQAAPETRHIPVVMMTASLRRDTDRLRALGCADVIQKPFELRTFPAYVRRILAGPRPAAENAAG